MVNNQRILKNINEYMKTIGLEGDKSNYYEIEYSGKVLLEDIAARLDIGAKKYGKQTPIDKEDDPSRNNPYEAYEELCDSLVYLSASLLRKTSNKKEINDIFYGVLKLTLKLMKEVK